MIEIIGALLEQHAHQAPESADAIFTQYYTEEEIGCLPMEAHSPIFEHEPFYQGAENQARPDIVYSEIHRKSVSGGMKGPPQESHTQEHEQKSEEEAGTHECDGRNVSSAGVIQSSLEHPEHPGIVSNRYQVQPPFEG